MNFHPTRPDGPVVMRPNWRHLLFLHWDFDPQTVQDLLPAGLEVDTFAGRAYVGLVPFVMEAVRPQFVPNLGKFGHFYENFAELNVRTYVIKDGVRGVWFFSLDAASSLAVLTARAWFHLPYFKARIRFWRGKDGAGRFWSKRLWPAPSRARCSLKYRVTGEAKPAAEGSLEQWLVERYVLYSRRGGQLFRGRVHHAPYQIQGAQVENLRESYLEAAGFLRPDQAPHAKAPHAKAPHAVYSRGVEVEVWPLELC